jgi:hypothetical protein
MIKSAFYKQKKFWLRLTLCIVLIPVLFFTAVVALVHTKQDEIVKELIAKANEDFKGAVQLEGSHVSAFAQFPYISIDLENLEIFEGKELKRKNRLLHLSDVYVGFNVMSLIRGTNQIKSIKLKNGKITLVQHHDGSFNITNALQTTKTTEKVQQDLHLDLKSIRLDHIDITKLNEATNQLVDTYITDAKAAFTTSNKRTSIDLKSRFELSIIHNKDTSFIKRKHFYINTELQLNHLKKKLAILPTEIELENATFGFRGHLDLTKDLNLDLRFKGQKPDFNLFLALAPTELASSLASFKNKGEIFFLARVKGPCLNGKTPAINARFGCKDGYFDNIETSKKLNQIGFKGTFTNGKARDISTMKFTLENFSAKPEAGVFSGKLVVENFASPEIDMRLNSDFDLDYLTKFLNIKELRGLSGRVALTMNFHDIIDFEHPEKTIEKLNESYYSELNIENLKFKSKDFHLPLDGLNMKAKLHGHQAIIEKFNLKVGKSDLALSGKISDLPAIIHHTDQIVETDLNITSKFLDLQELTKTSDEVNGIDEQIENLSLGFKFLSSAKALTESPHLPIGEFFIENLYAKLKHYPHVLHDFQADILIKNRDFRVVDFTGYIDQSDFHFSGQLENYSIWLDDRMSGDTKIEFDLTSKLLQFDNLFTYRGERFVPEDYRHEEVKNLKLHGNSTLHFNHGLKSTHVHLTQLAGSLKMHPLYFEKFSGDLHFENDHLSVRKLKGKLGKSNFEADVDYFFGKGKGKRENSLSLSSSYLDFDELLNFDISSNLKEENVKTDHDAVFSIYDFEFPDLLLKLDIDHLNYHHHILKHFKLDTRLTNKHTMRFNTFSFDAAGGHFDVKGYLTGADKKHIYFKPDIRIRNVDLDKLMVKFDNFGQDYLVSDNLHGIFSGHITGKVHLHADLVPILDDSELSVEMMVLNGRLDNYAPIVALAEYFQDKNVNSVRFDTLSNVFTVKKSNLVIPKMTIHSSLGSMELRGNQRLDQQMSMDYVIGVPWKIIGDVGRQKLFGKGKKGTQNNDSEIQYSNANTKMVYIKITGDIENYKFSLGRKER